MSVLVTGGAGYIGSHTVRALCGAGVDVVVLDSLEYGHREAVLDAPLEVGNIADEALVQRIVEQMLHWFDECDGMRSVALRYFNAAGASVDARIGEDNPRPLNLVPLAMQAALGQIPLLMVNGTDYPTPDGSTIRDYIHVDDLADAHTRALAYLEHGGASTVVNVGTGRGASTLEVIEGTKRISGVDFTTKPGPRRPGDPTEVYADNRRARELLGLQPQYDLDDILASAWRWHSSHPEGYGTSR
ncbi:MAG: NAD-dependent epimerase/dehydratase family protein [Acidimicrobiia bacterium]